MTMSRELIALIEFDADDALTGRVERRTYEVYEGDFIEVVGSSANGYWRDRSKGVKAGESITREARLLVTSDGGYIGHWNTLDEIMDFIRNYLRCPGSITTAHADGSTEILGPIIPA